MQHTLTTGLMTTVLWCSPAFVPNLMAQNAGQPAPLSLGELALCVEAARSQISDLSVSFRFDASAAPANQLFARSHRTVSVKGSKIFSDHEYGAMAEYESGTYRVTASFDGLRTSSYLAHMRRASFIAAREDIATTKGMGFFDIMMWNPCSTDKHGYHDMDLHSVLVSSLSSVRPFLEDIDGHACLVVDQRDTAGGAVTFSAWIDPARGFLPIQQRWAFAANGRTIMEFFIHEAQEVHPGLWVPMRGRKINYMLPGVPECDRQVEYTLEVDGFEAGQPAVTVNSGLQDDAFDVIASLPPGVKVYDRDGDRSWIVAGRDFKKMGESFDMQLANYRERDEHLNRRLSGSEQMPESTTSRSRSTSVIYCGIGASLTGFGLVGFWVRRRGMI